MTIETRLKLNHLLSQYKSKYEKYYPKSQFEFVMENFVKDFETTDGITSLLLQAYEECGLSEELQCNVYGNFINHLKTDCNINGDLLEVGCGILPALANKVSKEQKSGSVTVMDPKVIESYEGNIGIIKKSFTEETDVSNYDLIYGFYPCQATPEMIKSSFKNDKDLFLEMCGCVHNIPTEFESFKKNGNKYAIYLSYLEYILEQLSSTDRTYEIIRYPDLAFQVVRTY